MIDVTKVVSSYLAQKALAGVKIPVQAFNSGRVKVAIKLSDLLKKTNSFSVKNKPRCSSTIYRVEKVRGRWMFRVKCSEKTSDPSGHIVRVKALPGRSSDINTRELLVSCTCPGFLYWGGTYNCQSNKYWDGTGKQVAPPTQHTNLKAGFYICKHIATALEQSKTFIAPKSK